MRIGRSRYIERYTLCIARCIAEELKGDGRSSKNTLIHDPVKIRIQFGGKWLYIWWLYLGDGTVAVERDEKPDRSYKNPEDS